jgi:prephenate dehydrogenase
VTGQRPGAIAFLGLGLIGGSIVKALNADAAMAGGDAGSGPRGRPRITAWTPGGEGPALAVRAGLVDRVAKEPGEAIAGSDLVVIAAPPSATIELIERLGSDLRRTLPQGAVVTDVASTKARVMAAAASAGIRFVGGHPMAGRETAGFGASSPDLFRDRPWVVVRAESTDPDVVGPVEWLLAACGARQVELDAFVHDAAVAAISHLPLVASAALVEAVAGADRADWPLARSLAASGWEGMTRLARGDPRMGAGIAATNAPAIVAELRAYRAAIESWIAELDVETPDPGRLEARLDAVRALLDHGRDAG